MILWVLSASSGFNAVGRDAFCIFIGGAGPTSKNGPFVSAGMSEFTPFSCAKLLNCLAPRKFAVNLRLAAILGRVRRAESRKIAGWVYGESEWGPLILIAAEKVGFSAAWPRRLSEFL